MEWDMSYPDKEEVLVLALKGANGVKELKYLVGKSDGKLSISLPIIYAIWFCSVQYSRERRLEGEHAFKASISISLDASRELVEKLIVRDKPEKMPKCTAVIIESVGRVFTLPTEIAFDHPKDSTLTEVVIEASGEVAKDIIRLVK